MQLPISGPTYEHPSQDVNYQKCINLFATPGGAIGRADQTQTVLLPTPGKKSLVNIASAKSIRAIINFDDTVFVVADNTVYKLTINEDDQSATTTALGTIDSSEGYISWARNPTQIMLVNGTTSGYIITPADNTVTKITDVDFTGGEMVVFMDGYFIYNTPNASTIYATAVNDGTSVDALDVTTAEGNPDRTVGLAVDKIELWVFGERSVEVYWDAANPTAFPFARREGAHINLGCGAKGSILNFDNTLIWLDHRGYIVKANGYIPEVISNPAVSARIQSYDKIDDAIAMQSFDRGHLFYIISFPSQKETWAYDAVTNQWHQRAYFNQNDEFEHDLFQCAEQYKRLNLVGSRNTGDVFIIDKDTYTDGGDPIHRVRTSPFFQVGCNQVVIDSLEIHFESGKAVASDPDPQIMLRYSHDGGYTWSNEITRSFGKLGEYDKRVRWNRLGSGREWLFEFTIVAPMKFAIVDAYIDPSIDRESKT